MGQNDAKTRRRRLFMMSLTTLIEHHEIKSRADEFACEEGRVGLGSIIPLICVQEARLTKLFNLSYCQKDVVPAQWKHIFYRSQTLSEESREAMCSLNTRFPRTCRFGCSENEKDFF